MSNLPEYTLLLSRDFSLPSIEAWIDGENKSITEWIENKQLSSPYIIANRSDETVHFYYNVDYFMPIVDYLIRSAQNNNDFIPNISNTVLENVSFLQSIYEREQAIASDLLKKFLEELHRAYTYCNAMWLFGDLSEDKIKDLDLTSLKAARKATEKLCDSSDTVICKSLLKIYPQLGELSSVLSIEEIITQKIPKRPQYAAEILRL